MIKGVDHVGLAVENLENAKAVFDQLLQQPSEGSERVESEQLAVSFYHTAQGKLEFIQGLSEDSNITQYIRKNGEGIHHIALAVDDVHYEIERLTQQGFQVVNETPQLGAGNKLICFLHPKSTNGILVELCQEADG